MHKHSTKPEPVKADCYAARFRQAHKLRASGLQRIWMDQEDAALLQEGEEVTLMEWGNAIVKVRLRGPWVPQRAVL